MAQFYSRRFNTSKQLESFVNVNTKRSLQIVSINHTAFLSKKGETISAAYLYFYTDMSLGYDLYNELDAEEREAIARLIIEVEQDGARKERIETLRAKLEYHTDPENISVRESAKDHQQEASRIKALLEESENATYAKVVTLTPQTIVPKNVAELTAEQFLDKVKSINPAIKISTKWIYIKNPQ
jgi:hypothetical protein